jgi:hypothetical protein
MLVRLFPDSFIIDDHQRKQEEEEEVIVYSNSEDEDEDVFGVSPETPESDSPEKWPTVEPVERYDETPIPFNRRYTDIGPAYRRPLSATSSSAGCVYIWDAVSLFQCINCDSD